MSTAPNVLGAEQVAESLELEHVQSHLHPEPSFDVADHPKPTGLEEIWRFTPLKRLRGLLDGTPSEGDFLWKEEIPTGATLSTISTDEAKALGGIAPLDRLAALAVENAQGARLLQIDGELTEPVRITLTGESVDTTIWGHVVVKVAPFSKATIALDHVGSATYDAQVTYLIGDGAQLDVVNLNDWENDTVHTVQNSITVGRDAAVRFFEFTLG